MEPVRNFPDWKQGEPVSLEEMARLQRLAEEGSQATGGEGIDTFTGNGGIKAVASAGRPRILIRLTGSDGAGSYSWKLIQAANSAAEYLALDLNVTGTYGGAEGGDGGPAREVNGNTSIRTGEDDGTIVEAWLADEGAFWEFVLPAIPPVITIIEGPPPWEDFEGILCNQLFTDGTFLGFWNCATETFVMFCECYPYEGYGSGSNPDVDVPGECHEGECAECDEAPESWEIIAAGFTADCTLFNATWNLVSVDECIWRGGAVIDGINVVVTLTLDSGGNTLDFEAYSSEGLLVSSSYTNDASDLPDCCVPLTFDEDTCSCDYQDASGDYECSECTTTPGAWRITVTGFTGCFRRFNGTHILVIPSSSDEGGIEPCFWRDEEALASGLNIGWTIKSDGSGVLGFNDTAQAPHAVATYTSAVFGPDCCSNVTASRTYTACGRLSGGSPATITVEPLCEGVAGACPDTLTATPVCCSDEPPDEPVCDCDQCPDGAPPRWTFRQVNCTAEFIDALGEWFLEYDSGCVWTQTRGEITARLSYDDTVSRWELLFTHSNGTSFELMRNRSPFLCCGDNRFVVCPGPLCHEGIGHTDDFADISPDGPCSPCGDGGGGGTATSCCPSNDIPDEVDATFANGTGTCAGVLNGLSLTLTKDPVFDFWEGEYEAVSGKTNRLRLLCQPTGWFVTNFVDDIGACGWGASPGIAASSTDCAGHEIVFPVLGEGSCCVGTATVAVTW